MLLLDLNNTILHNNINALNEGYELSIPMAYAREEDNVKISQEDVENIPHYELYITKQVGTVRNRRNTNIYLRLPKSKRLVNIILYMDGGVGFDPIFHKYIIRELDETDRRIILGFCSKYQEALRAACYMDKEDKWLKMDALRYKISDMPKRIKTGPSKFDFSDLYYDLKPYEESSKIFNKLAFI